MPEPHPRTELDQAFPLGRCRRVGADAEPVERPPQQGYVADRLDRRGQCEHAGVGRQGRDPPLKSVLYLAGDRARAVSAEAECELRRRQAPRQLQQGERVAARLGHDPIADARVNGPDQHGFEQGPGVGVGQAGHAHLGHPGEQVLVTAGTRGEDQCHRVGVQAPGHEGKDHRGHTVGPLDVVDQAEQGVLGSRFGQQPEHGHPQQQRIGRAA